MLAICCGCQAISDKTQLFHTVNFPKNHHDHTTIIALFVNKGNPPQSIYFKPKPEHFVFVPKPKQTPTIPRP